DAQPGARSVAAPRRVSHGGGAGAAAPPPDRDAGMSVRMGVAARIALAGLGSLALLLGALGFQYLGGLAPCPMCIWQRWPHLAAVVLAIAALAMRRSMPRLGRPLVLAGAAAAAVAAGLGVFHAGVEQGWWDGPSSCVGPDPSGVS